MQFRTLWMFGGLAIALAMGLPAAAGAANVTRTLQQSIQVPAGGSLIVENLVGHMTVTQGSGPAQVTATVVAGDDDAAALAQSVKLELSTAGKQVRVHVYYPVDRFGTFRYNPPNAQAEGSGEACILGNRICIHGSSHSTVHYQGARVRVDGSSVGSGAPLYVDVAVRLPAQVSASLDNAVGLLEANGLADNLALATQGSDIHVRTLDGSLDARSGGGDITLDAVTSAAARVHTGGGDLTGNNLSGTLRLATGGGDARLDSVAGALDLDTGGGDANLGGTLSALHTLRVRSGGGDLTVRGNLAALGLLDANSGGGDLVLRASGLSLHLDASSGGGDLDVNLPHLSNVTRSSDHFSADIGKAVGRGTLRSSGGDLTVSQP